MNIPAAGDIIFIGLRQVIWMEKLFVPVQKVIEQVNRVILGKEREVREIMLAFLANGHVLLEDIPGVGKTTLALAFSRAMELEYRRIQFTPDVLPSDLTGFSIYRRDKERFVYQKGSVFCNLLLADELNRTSPKTQSALLEVMEERKVTVEGITRSVPSPFLVIATQNPSGAAGTQSLPEAQVDRFTASLSIGYPDFESELSMAMGVSARSRVEPIQPVMDRALLLQAQEAASGVYLGEPVSRYLVELVRATREHRLLARGASPQATIALVRMARAAAWLEGRGFVTPGDVAGQFPYVIRHRLLLNNAARMEHMEKAAVIEEILSSVPRPPMGKER